jgi:hypothetical protein
MLKKYAGLGYPLANVLQFISAKTMNQRLESLRRRKL